MTKLMCIAALLLLSGCGVFEEHQRKDGETVYRIKPEAATSLVQAVESVMPVADAPEPKAESKAEAPKTAYVIEVTGRKQSSRLLPTITTDSVSICFSEGDCLRVVDSVSKRQITGDFNGFDFVLSNTSQTRFFHGYIGAEKVFRLSPVAAPSAWLANVSVKNIGNNTFEVRLRAEDYPEYDIDARLIFDGRGELVSCVAKRLSTGQKTIIEDAPNA